MNTETEVQPQTQEILQTLRRFYRQEVLPVRRAMDSDPQLCKKFLKRLGELGYLIPTLSEEYGGIGASRQLRALMSKESCRVSPALGLSIGAHGLLATNAINFFGSPEQKKKYLPKLASGELIGAWGVTEPGAGSDVGGMESTAVLKGDHYVLNGNKTFITNAPICDVAIVYAKLSKDPESITCFIVERGQEGLEFGNAIEKFGMEGSPTGDIYMENVKVPLDRVIGKPGEGFKQIKKIFNYERMYLAGGALGMMEHCLETALKYSAQRKTFGQPIMNYQAIQLKIAGIYSRIAMLDMAAKDLYSMSDDDPNFHLKASSIKIHGGKWLVDTCLDTMQILGGLGYTRESDIERYLRDAKLYEIGGGTTDIQHLIIFKGILKKYSDVIGATNNGHA